MPRKIQKYVAIKRKKIRQRRPQVASGIDRRLGQEQDSWNVGTKDFPYTRLTSGGREIYTRVQQPIPQIRYGRQLNLRCKACHESGPCIFDQFGIQLPLCFRVLDLAKSSYLALSHYTSPS
jgi:hypothetical protein